MLACPIPTVTPRARCVRGTISHDKKNDERGSMAVLANRPAPDFTVQAVMEDGSTQEVSLSSYKGSHVVLFFYPKDFTFV